MTVLLADEIKKRCESNAVPPMIDPFSASQLRPASYQLTLGHEIHLGRGTSTFGSLRRNHT